MTGAKAEGARLVLCADDFGRSAAINDGIVTLARAGRLSAVTVMACEPHVGHRAADLAELSAAGELQLGLHLALTDGPAHRRLRTIAKDGRLPTIDRLTFKAWTGSLPLGVIRLEVCRQFDAFEALFGRAPDFIDGHQHVHVLPGIRNVILKEAARRRPAMWVRSCEEAAWTIASRGGDWSRATRAAWLSRGMRADAAAAGLRSNDGFAGLYDLGRPGRFFRHLSSFLRRVSARNHLVICHPAGWNDPHDPIGTARSEEFVVLGSAAMLDRVAAQHLTIAPLG